MTATYLGRCDDWPDSKAELFWDFDATAVRVTYRTFLKHVGGEEVRRLDYRFGVPLSRDWHVRFLKGTFDGKKVVCLKHSSYHYLWKIN